MQHNNIVLVNGQDLEWGPFEDGFTGNYDNYDSEHAVLVEKLGAVNRVRIGDGAEVIQVDESWDIDAALKAATSFFLYRKYDHPDTGPGAHIFAGSDFSQITPQSNLGVIGASYKGKKFPVPQYDFQDANSRFWMQLNTRLQRPYLAGFKQNKARQRTRIHDYIEYLLLGYTLVINIAPIRSLAATILMQWMCENIEDAQTIKNERIDAAQKREEMNAAFGWGPKAKNGNGGRQTHHPLRPQQEEPAADAPKVEGTLMVLVHGGSKRKNMFNVPAGRYQIFCGRSSVGTLPWDPTNADVVQGWEDGVVAEGYEVKLG